MAQAEQANAELTRQLAAERRAAKQAGAGAQKQLLGCMRRLQYMVHPLLHKWICCSNSDLYTEGLTDAMLEI